MKAKSDMNLLDLALPYQREVILDKSPFKVLNFSRQVGKSWTAAFLATKKCIEKDGQLVIYLSTGQRASDEALKTCLKFADAVKVLSDGKLTYTSNASCITFSNKSRIMAMPSSPTACRGWQASMLILDEIAFWQDAEECWTAIIPTLTNKLSNSSKELVICSTPSGINNIFYELCQKAKDEQDWKYFQVTIHDAIRQGLKADLEQLHTLMPDPQQFATEFECQFCNSSNSLIDTHLLQFYDCDQQFDEYFCGVDFGRYHDATAITVVGRDKDNVMHLCDMTVLNNVEYQKQLAVIKQVFERHQPKEMLCDAGGLGSPLVEQLNTQVNARIKPFTFNQKNKSEAYEFFRKSVFDRKLKIHADFKDKILDDILLVRQEISDSGKVTYSAKRSSNSHSDTMSSLILALQAAHNNRTQLSLPTSFGIQSAFGSFRSRL